MLVISDPTTRGMLRITEATSLLGGPITATKPDGITFTANPSALTIFPADAFPAVADPRCDLAEAGPVEVAQADPTISPRALGSCDSGVPSRPFNGLCGLCTLPDLPVDRVVVIAA